VPQGRSTTISATPNTRALLAAFGVGAVVRSASTLDDPEIAIHRPAGETA